MFEKKTQNEDKLDSMGVFRPTKGSAKVIIGNGVKLKGEITDALAVAGIFKVKYMIDKGLV